MSDVDNQISLEIKPHWQLADAKLSEDHWNYDPEGNALIDLGDFFEKLDDDALSESEIETLFLISLFRDLTSSGWRITVKGNELVCSLDENDDPQLVRDRNVHLRDLVLGENAHQDFISYMERPKKTNTGQHSIFSLIRDGSELAEEIQSANKLDSAARAHRLAEICKPYICPIIGEERCEKTGLKLRDIFRYFRTTWSAPYSTAPSRQLGFLIRDAAQPNHPVIGIAELRSSVIRLVERDEWLGWSGDQILTQLQQHFAKKDLSWFLRVLEDRLDEIYRDDFEAEGLLLDLEVQYPSQRVIKKLRDFAIIEAKLNRSSGGASGLASDDFLGHAKTPLYRSKRAAALADLLSVRDVFQRNNVEKLSSQKLTKLACDNEEFEAGLLRLVTMIRGNNVGIQLMDITTAGAIAPYNSLLGGKLVCMLLASPEVVEIYNQRYGQQVSDIASKMAAREITRTPNLSVLCTTSLYSRNSSQYNRIVIPKKEVVRGAKNGEIRYQRLGRSKGQGTSHISEQTKKAMYAFLNCKGWIRGKQKFSMGEGTSPLLRDLAQAVRFCDVPDGLGTRHTQRRIIYGINLIENASDFLLDRTEKAKHVLGLGNTRKKTEAIVNWWRKRWFFKRCLREEVITALSKETLAYPITHAARSPAYKLREADPNLDLPL